MTKQQAEKNLQEAIEARRAIQARTISNEAALAEAIRVERLARYEVSRFVLATMPEGSKFWSTGL
jgi:hypothetical protein